MWRKFKPLSTVSKAGIIGSAVVLAGMVGSSNPNPQTQKIANLTSQQVNQKTQQTQKAQQPKPVVTTQDITETQSIPFASTTVEDATLAKGQTKIITAGVNGTETLTYKVTYTDGKQTAKDLVSQVVITPPINQVTAMGTYVAPSQPTCPNGTYVNSAGNTVCSPYQSNSAPIGATAQCRDGSYSFSQSRSGTCSHHGGAASWL